MWEQLKEIALIGSDKKAFDLDLLPLAIKEQVEKKEKLTDEEKVLESLVYVAYYQEVGEKYAKVSSAIELPLIEESLDVGDVKIMSLLNQIEKADTAIKESLLNLWLDALMADSSIVHARYVLNLIKLANGYAKETKRKVMQVVGEKGRWLLSNFNHYKYDDLSESEQTWQEGKLDQRKSYLESLRMQDISASIQCLKSTWNSESIGAKKAFLTIVSESYNSLDLEFISTLYEQEFAFKSNEKKSELACRNLLANMLLREESSQLYQYATAQLTKYFVKRKRSGMLGLLSSEQEVFDLPVTSDAFFNKEVMLQRFGFETEHYDISLYANMNLYWLSIFLENIPFGFWKKFFKKEGKEMLWYFLGDAFFKVKIKGKSQSVFQESLIWNAIINQSEELAVLLTKELTVDECIRVLPCMTKENYEDYVLKKHLLADIRVLNMNPYLQGETWSIPFSKDFISNAYEMIDTAYYNTYQQLAKIAAIYLEASVESFLDKYDERAKSSKDYNLWNKHFYQLVKDSLNIRNKLNH